MLREVVDLLLFSDRILLASNILKMAIQEKNFTELTARPQFTGLLREIFEQEAIPGGVEASLISGGRGCRVWVHRYRSSHPYELLRLFYNGTGRRWGQVVLSVWPDEFQVGVRIVDTEPPPPCDWGQRGRGEDFLQKRFFYPNSGPIREWPIYSRPINSPLEINQAVILRELDGSIGDVESFSQPAMAAVIGEIDPISKYRDNNVLLREAREGLIRLGPSSRMARETAGLIIGHLRPRG